MAAILAHGATGTCVARVTALARAAGIDVEQHTDTEPLPAATIDTILASLAVADQEERLVPPGAVYKGRFIDQGVWDELEARAAEYTGLTVPQPPVQGGSSTITGAGEHSGAPAGGAEGAQGGSPGATLA